MENKLSLTKIGAWAGAIMAILTLLWFIGEPALERYVDTHISTYEGRKAEEDSKKVKLRHLLSTKMGVDDDEVHIEIGNVYKKVMAEPNIKHVLDSLGREVELNYHEIGVNTEAINKLQKDNKYFRKQLDKHGLFH